jgi:hypothetical protein
MQFFISVLPLDTGVPLVRSSQQVMNLQPLGPKNNGTGNVSAAFMTRIRQTAHQAGIREPSKLRKRLRKSGEKA